VLLLLLLVVVVVYTHVRSTLISRIHSYSNHKLPTSHNNTKGASLCDDDHHHGILRRLSRLGDPIGGIHMHARSNGGASHGNGRNR